MKKLITLLLVVTCSTMLMATGSSDSNGGSNGSSNGMDENGKIMGTVQEVMPQDSIFTISKDNGMIDTVKVTDRTKMSGTLSELKSGDQVEVMFETRDNQKMAKSIKKMKEPNRDGSNGSRQDTSGMRDTSGMKSDTMPY